MSLGKKDIVINISSKAHISRVISAQLVKSFFNILKSSSSGNTVKIANFGTFYKRITPERIGRNPKTKEEYTIKARKRISFKASRNLIKILN